MTLTCPSESCPFCVGDACNACKREPRAPGHRCNHGRVERHVAIPALEPDLVATTKTPVVLAGRIEIDLDDSAGAADFIELVAKVIRAKKRLVLVIE